MSRPEIAAHTPGPWTLGDADPLLVVGPETRFMDDGQGGLGLSAVAVALQSLNPAEDAANARLIAAAPELLAACEAIAANTDLVEEGRGVVSKLQEIARTAIASARGGAR